MHTVYESAMAALNRAQKIGACAITGAFHTVALAVVEAEAYIRPIPQRQFDRATKLYLGLCTFPETHPLAKLRLRIFRKFKSPLQRISLVHQPLSKIETIQPFSVAP